MFTFPVTALTALSLNPAYVALKLPNVPSAKRVSVANAASASAIGQGYSAESVIDAIALATLWLSPDPLSCFQDSGATTPSAIGQVVGAMVPWVGSVTVTQNTSSAKGILTTSGIDFDGVDDVLVGTPPQTSTAHSIIAVIKSDTISGARIPIYIGDASNNGYGFYWDSSTGALYGGVTFLNDGTRNTSTNIHSLTKGATSKLFINGVETPLSNPSVSPFAPSAFFTYGGYVGSNYHDGTIADVFVYDSEFSDRHKIERFANAYRSLGLL